MFSRKAEPAITQLHSSYESSSICTSMVTHTVVDVLPPGPAFPTTYEQCLFPIVLEFQLVGPDVITPAWPILQSAESACWKRQLVTENVTIPRSQVSPWLNTYSDYSSWAS